MIDGCGWSTLLSSDDIEDWRLRVGHLLGPHEIRQGDAAGAMRFHHRIRAASAGALQLLDFSGGGSFALGIRVRAEGPVSVVRIVAALHLLQYNGTKLCK